METRDREKERITTSDSDMTERVDRREDLDGKTG